MKESRLLELIEARHKECKSTMERKGNIYTDIDNRLSNFQDVAAMNHSPQQVALWGMVSKHIIVVKDMVQSNKNPSREWIADNLGGIHNYLYLLEAIWEEDRRLWGSQK